VKDPWGVNNPIQQQQKDPWTTFTVQQQQS